MEKLVTLITPTGGRPEAFDLCKHYMREQTYKGAIQWIVVSDEGRKGEPLTPEYDFTPNIKVDEIRGSKLWGPGINTQRTNLDAALPHVQGDIVLFIEDDDWYHPGYIQTMVSLLNSFPFVGELAAKYYNVGYKSYREMGNYEHASLCQTGFRADQLGLVEQAINSGELFIDIVLWEKVRELKIPHMLFAQANMCIGIKGMPGRFGIGVGHTPKEFIQDGTGSKLKEWVGEDFKLYEEYLGNAMKKRVAAQPQVSPSKIWTQDNKKIII